MVCFFYLPRSLLSIFVAPLFVIHPYSFELLTSLARARVYVYK
jgi:hypothetical protein